MKSLPCMVVPPAWSAAKPGIAAGRCTVLFEARDRRAEHRLLPSLPVAGLAVEQAFVLPPDAPAELGSIPCGRCTIVPGPNHDKPLQAGHPLPIVVDRRVGILEAAGGRLRFRTLEGALTGAEADRVQHAIEALQQQFDGQAVAASGAAR